MGATDFHFNKQPWENSLFPSLVRDDEKGGDPHLICQCVHIMHPDALFEMCHRANVANDLLSALQAIVSSLSDQDDEGMIEHAPQMQAARAAIAKAEDLNS